MASNTRYKESKGRLFDKRKEIEAQQQKLEELIDHVMEGDFWENIKRMNAEQVKLVRLEIELQMMEYRSYCKPGSVRLGKYRI